MQHFKAVTVRKYLPGATSGRKGLSCLVSRGLQPIVVGKGRREVHGGGSLLEMLLTRHRPGSRELAGVSAGGYNAQGNIPVPHSLQLGPTS